MSPTPVLYGQVYGPAIYEIIRAECPADLRIDFLEGDRQDELLERLPGYGYVIGGDLKRRHFEAAPGLRLLQCLGVGYDSVDLDAARDHGVAVATTPEGTVEGVAEHVMLMALALNKQLLVADAALRRGEWLVWQLRATSHMMFGQVFGIVGLGRIGREVAKRARAFGVDLVYFDPERAAAAVEAELGVRYLPFDELLRTVDVLSLSTPLDAVTRHLVGERELGLMKRGAVVINTSRGGVIDERVLVRALEEGRIRGAGLDVFEAEPTAADNPLLSMRSTVLTPHIATGTRQAMAIKARAQFANIARVVAGEPPINRVA